MNVGTIIENPMLKIKLGTKTLGNIEEVFIQNLSQGDSFIFAGRVLEFQSMKNNLVQVKRSKSLISKIPSYSGGRMPLSTNLANSVRDLLAKSNTWDLYPDQITEWLKRQKAISKIPKKDEYLVEQFPRKKNFYTVIYTFAGWHANQTLGFLLLRGFKEFDYKPLGFVANDYAIVLWSLKEVKEIKKILNIKLLHKHLDNYLEETSIVKRLFRDNAIISCLIERRLPGMEKTGKQVLFSSDLIYTVLKKNEPDHILLKSSYEDAKKNMIDYDRLREILKKIDKKIILMKLKSISPLAVPIILEINRENLSKKETDDYILEDLENEILKEANVLSIN
jgi:ATP-dependent Lhr-like helicase